MEHIKSERTLTTTLLHRRGTYKEFVNKNPVIYDGELIIVHELPWYRSWFGLKPTRLKAGVGRPFKETRFI